jgi:hypothetical protein
MLHLFHHFEGTSSNVHTKAFIAIAYDDGTSYVTESSNGMRSMFNEESVVSNNVLVVSNNASCFISRRWTNKRDLLFWLQFIGFRKCLVADELTQEAKEAKRQETDILEGCLKSTMKRVAKSDKKCTSNDSQVEKTKSKTKSKSLTKKKQKTKAVKCTDNVVAPVAKSTTKTTKPKKVGELQDQRKVPEPSDQHGCTHSGLMELIAL